MLYGQWKPPAIELSLYEEDDPKGTARTISFEVGNYQRATDVDIGDSTSPLRREILATRPRER